jgi:hypothetical protein
MLPHPAARGLGNSWSGTREEGENRFGGPMLAMVWPSLGNVTTEGQPLRKRYVQSHKYTSSGASISLLLFARKGASSSVSGRPCPPS